MGCPESTREAFRHFKADDSLWRYVDFAKFVAMLEDRAFQFQSPRAFVDPFEGGIHGAILHDIARKFFLEHCKHEPGLAENFEKMSHEQSEASAWRHYERRLSEAIVVSCWHRSEHESDAMWRLYAKPDQALAVRSDVISLAAILPEVDGDILPLSYVDYDEKNPPANGSLFVKRKAFEHEKEARAFFFSRSAFTWQPGESSLPQEALAFRPSEVIREVVVNPLAESWYEKLVEKLVSRYGYDIPVRGSSMRRRPAFLDAHELAVGAGAGESTRGPGK